MEISCAFPPGPAVVDHIVEAERLGYERAWLFDSPALYSDIWVIAALAAQRTARISLGPAVLVPNLRHPLAQASAIATLEQLAPGRVAVAIGTGFTGRMAMGQNSEAESGDDAVSGREVVGVGRRVQGEFGDHRAGRGDLFEEFVVLRRIAVPKDEYLATLGRLPDERRELWFNLAAIDARPLQKHVREEYQLEDPRFFDVLPFEERPLVDRGDGLLLRIEGLLLFLGQFDHGYLLSGHPIQALDVRIR